MAVEGIRVEGETVEEAVRKAAELLGILPGEVAVEVIDAGSRGILGFGRRRAVILVRPMLVDGSPSEGERRTAKERRSYSKMPTAEEKI